MKNKKIIFAGFMAAILVAAGATDARAEIAAKSYVDNQNTLQSATILSTVDTNLTNNYSTTTQVGGLITTAVSAVTADTSALTGRVAAAEGAITTLGTDKANVSDVNTKNDLQDAAIAGKANQSTTYTMTEVDAALSMAITGANTNVTNLTTTVTNLGDTVTTNATDTAAALALKANTTDVNTKNDSQDTAIGLKADTTAVDTANAMQNTEIGLKANTADLKDLAFAAPGACSDAANKCLLSFDGTTYAWEVVER